MRSKTLTAVAFLAVFIAGIAAGVFGSARHAHHMFLMVHGPQMRGRIEEHLKRELNLTPAQQQQIAPIVDEMSKRLEDIRGETGHNVSATMRAAHDKMLPLLNDEQKRRLNEMQQRHIRAMHHVGAPPAP